MVRDLNFDSPVRRGLDRQRLTSSPIDSCFDREWTARDLEIEDSIAGDGADLRAVDEDLVSPEPICESRAANTPEPGGSACGHRGPPRSPGRASLLWTSSSLVASSSGRRRPSARPAARLFLMAVHRSATQERRHPNQTAARKLCLYRHGDQEFALGWNSCTTAQWTPETSASVGGLVRSQLHSAFISPQRLRKNQRSVT